MPELYILLPVHNRRETTRRFLECLRAQTFQDYHLLLIDDGSTDGTAEMAREFISTLTVLGGSGDWWWAGSLQQGIEWLKQRNAVSESFVLMINDDVTFEPQFLERAVALLQSAPRTLLLAQAVSKQTGRPLVSGVEADLKHWRFQPSQAANKINCLTTNGLFLRWADLQQIGGFHPRWLPHYNADYEFTLRAYRKGFRLHVSPELQLVWDEKTTGFHRFDRMPLAAFLRQYFSKKSLGNPVYHSAFVLLVSPRLRIPVHLAKIWWGALLTVGRRAFALK
ncbi:MAG TPA: glycosyltransferase [Blastocatellia bacterium]|nr:glycosyltransferase [Blastocatellia bacterium]HMV82084.1 glycosyltransferase [Blastocatellia bacterium]HMX28597.1 glycosyltransferase [Blastocatellia bacterium]HMY70500.1 glycosyltransferase [Blastocatellia bacterium]HMZ17929.1 glycosyltransferase [Blastocatellia bacterium]